jgi:hypothetical protein
MRVLTWYRQRPWWVQSVVVVAVAFLVVAAISMVLSILMVVFLGSAIGPRLSGSLPWEAAWLS